MSLMTPRQFGVFLLCVLSFYLGGGFESPPDIQEPKRIEVRKTVEIEKPYLPINCKEAMLSNSNYDTDMEKQEMVNGCFDEVGVARQDAERSVAISNAFARYQITESEGDNFSEAQLEAAFELCEIEYGDTDYCDDNLDDFLEDIEPVGE